MYIQYVFAHQFHKYNNKCRNMLLNYIKYNTYALFNPFHSPLAIVKLKVFPKGVFALL